MRRRKQLTKCLFEKLVMALKHQFITKVQLAMLISLLLNRNIFVLDGDVFLCRRILRKYSCVLCDVPSCLVESNVITSVQYVSIDEKRDTSCHHEILLVRGGEKERESSFIILFCNAT